MARTLLVTLEITINHLEGEDLELAREGTDDEYPVGDDTDLDETSPDEIAEMMVMSLPDLNDELWAGSNIFAKIEGCALRSSEWAV